MNARATAPDATRLFDEAARLAAAGDYVAALDRLLQSQAQDPSRVEPWYLRAQLQLQFGLHSEAIQAASIAAQKAPTWADCRYILGRALKAGARLEEAVVEYCAAIEIDPTRPHYFCSIGVAYRELGRTAEAIASYRAALALDPANREANNNLANALRQSGQEQEATRYDGAKSTLSVELDRLVNEAATLHARGEYKQALLRWTDVLRLAPDSALAHHAQAATLYELHVFDDALEYEERALTLEADHVQALDGAFKIATFAGDVEKIGRYGKRLQALQPSDAVRIKTALALPVVHESVAGILQTRQRFDAALDELLEAPLRVSRPDQTLGCLGFYLAYHGENDRSLQEKLGRLLIQSCPGLTWEAPHCRDYRRHTGRLRIGFASELFRNHSIGKTSSGLVAELSRERFEVFVLNLPGSSRADDATRQRLRKHCDHWLSLDGTLEQVRQAIADLKLDILFYQDIGMTSFSYFLAYSRLAPLQCVSFGHPDTTGIPNVDYFISNDLYEPADAVLHYSERLFLLESLPTLAYYYRPEEPTISVNRTDWGFGATDNLYVCAQTLFKLHPEFDALLAGILQRDPKARIVLISGQYHGWTEGLERRFSRTLGERARRVTFINRMSNMQYLALLRMADVALDTVHFNGMNSSLEALAMGTPVVTLPTHLQRGRHTQAMYRQMEVSDCIARDEQDYIDTVVRIGANPDYRQALQRMILERNPVLYENRRVVTEFERFFATALEATRP